MKRTAIYMRVSTQIQAKEGDSIPAQREALHKYIDERPDLVCVGEYLDDGISGTKYDRDELQRMIADVKEDKIDLICVTKMDRLHRSLRNFLNMQEILERHHCAWIAIFEPIYDTSTPQGKMIINTMMNLAQFEAENTGQRIRQVQAYKVAQGEVISGSVPPGYSIVNKRLVPNDDAETIRDIFNDYSMYGNLAKTIRLIANNPHFPQSAPAFKRMMQNETYIGRKRENDHFCEPIIDHDLFYDVQRKLKMNVKLSQKRTYIFSGLIRCKECGTLMGSCTYKKDKKTHIYIANGYRCAKRYCRGGLRQCTNTKVITESVLERYLLEHIRPQIKDMIIQYEIEQQPVKDNSARVAYLQKRKQRIKELFVNELIDLDEYKKDREDIESEIAALTARKPSECDDITHLKDLLSTDFETLYGTFNADEKRYFWRSIIKEIRFGSDRHYDIIFLT